MKKIDNISILGSSNRLITLDFTVNRKEKENTPTVIFCHGYKGFKDWGCWNLVADKFSDQGFNFLKFNLSHNGVTENNLLDFVDLEAFGNNNFTKELFDLNKVIDWVCNKNDFSSYINTDEIYLIGHSRGGGIVTLKTAIDSRVSKAITWASVSSLIDRIPKNIEEWKEKGVVYQKNGRTNQEMPLFYQLYENTTSNIKELDIEKLSKRIKVPFCIIHGKEDSVVSPSEAMNLDEWISTSFLILIEKANHTFGSKHPFLEKELPMDLNKVIEESVVFLTN